MSKIIALLYLTFVGNMYSLESKINQTLSAKPTETLDEDNWNSLILKEVLENGKLSEEKVTDPSDNNNSLEAAGSRKVIIVRQ